MTTRRGAMAVSAGMLTALLSGCAAWPGHRYRFRMTVEVDTPQGLRNGSSVMEIHVTKALWGLAESARAGVSLKGEAVAVDLPGDRTLFALLIDQNRDEIMTGTTRALRPGFVGGADDFVETAPKLSAMRESPPRGMAPEDYPLLVTFGDIRDPKTVAKVDPDDLASTFGPGVRLQKIMIAITDKPVTTGIEKRLEWLPSVYATMLDGSRYNNSPSLANSLSQDVFVSGRKL